jgi:hypothetical protein
VTRTIFAALFFFAACSPGYSNNCNMLIGSAHANWLEPSLFGDDTLQDALTTSLEALSAALDPRLQDPDAVCNRLSGYTLRTHTPQNWIDSWGRDISGETYCRARVIVVGVNPGQDWRETALAHELVHAGQQCNSPAPIDPGLDESHANWLRDGIYSALEVSNRR